MNSEEINTYIKKLQYVSNVINESYRDIILCTAVCAIPIILQYFISNMIQHSARKAANLDMFSDIHPSDQPFYPQNMDFQFLSRDFAEVVVWESLQEVLLVMTKIYHLRLFEEANDYEEDLAKDVKRLKQSSHLNPYETTFNKKLKQPDHALRLSRLVL